MSFSEYLVIEQPNGWWVMLEDIGMGPYPSRQVATDWAISTAKILENADRPASVVVDSSGSGRVVAYASNHETGSTW